MGDIKDTLALHGLSLAAAARILGVTKRALLYWDKGEHTPPTPVMIILNALRTGRLSAEIIEKLAQMPLLSVGSKPIALGKIELKNLAHEELFEQIYANARSVIGTDVHHDHDDEEATVSPAVKKLSDRINRKARRLTGSGR